ncbi:hypothetical protein [Streptomyces sp. NBC_01803]|uniref:hypothetical protein n=1 Tax=Streptomyces sp. NBC_01803 TaxID=2975946 RepID=UPI002DDBF5F5|nr:hypothetical protein [Streptomyces sp. NBC_01803]WSA45525.1 hypothetical protein OIE51_15760 [Streptomyces sp. NBC_01803]
MIDVFLTGRDRSAQFVQEIEDVLVADFLDTPVFEVLAEVVSLYRPGAGLPYTDEEEMSEALASARDLLTEPRGR